MKKFSNKDTLSDAKTFHPFILMAVFCAITYTVIQLILTPFYTIVLSDITLKTTVLPRILYAMLSLSETFAFALCYSIVIYTAVIKSTKTAIGACGIYVAASVVRRLGALGVSFVMYKYIDKRDIINVLIPIIIEAVQISIVLLSAHLLSKSFKKRHKVARQTNDLCNMDDIQFTKVYSKHNPLMTGAIISGAMLSLVNIAMRIYSDIGYGAPEDAAEILIMIVYYLSDVLICALFYAMAWVILSGMLARYKASN